MALEDFKRHLKSLKSAVEALKKEKLDLTIKEQSPGVYDYKKMRESSLKRSVPAFIDQVKISSSSLINELPGPQLTEILKCVNDLDIYYTNKDLKKLDNCVERIADAIADADVIQEKKMISVPKGIPAEIKEELAADIHELEKTFQTGCYRSSIILCGRILETLLHRKYFDVTGQDLLEKAPGIGLGKIIAKLKEKEVAIDPGLTQQIHLINQVRVFSVHTKQEPFYPSKEQAHGTILLTMDVINKFYGK